MIKVHVEGLGFPEGPVSLPDGRIAFVDLLHQTIRLHDGHVTTTLVSLSGSPNGMRLAPDGSLLVANNGGLAPLTPDKLWRPNDEISGRIQRISLSGDVSDVAVELPGAEPWRPNDLVLAPDGQIVFTDPHNWEVLPDEASYGGGRLVVVQPDGSCSLLTEVPDFPNGLVFQGDDALLVAQTIGHRILRFPWDTGGVGNPEVWAQLPERVNPDGLIIHDGLVYVAGSTGDEVIVLDGDAHVVHRYDTGWGSDPTNLTVHDGALWVTLGIPGQLVSLPLVSDL